MKVDCKKNEIIARPSPIELSRCRLCKSLDAIAQRLDGYFDQSVTKDCPHRSI